MQLKRIGIGTTAQEIMKPEMRTDSLFAKHILGIMTEQQLAGVVASEIIDPPQIELHPANNCSVDCAHCISHGAESNGAIDQTPLSKEDYARLFDDITGPKRSIPKVIFSGGVMKGDPLMSPHFNYLMERANLADMIVGVYTVGGRLLTPTILDGITNNMHKESHVKFNLCAYDEQSYQSIYHRNYYQLALRSIDRLAVMKEQKNSNVSIDVNYLLKPGINTDIEKIAGFAAKLYDLGVNYFKIAFPVDAHADTSEQGIQERTDFLKKLEARLAPFLVENIQSTDPHFRIYIYYYNGAPKKQFETCYINLFSPVVEYNGDFSLCCYNPQVSYGNLKQDSFWNIWYGQKHKDMANIDYSLCPPCSYADYSLNTSFDELAHER